MLNESELKTLLEVAEQVSGPFRSALHETTWREEFRQRFTPAVCAELTKEVRDCHTLLRFIWKEVLSSHAEMHARFCEAGVSDARVRLAQFIDSHKEQP